MSEASAVEPTGAPRIDLVLLGASGAPHWTSGEAIAVPGWRDLPATLSLLVEREQSPEAVLFWSPPDEPPAPRYLRDLLLQPDDAWHAGLSRGMSSLPHYLDYVVPTWPFHRDAPPDVESMSWRLSFRACLLRTSAMRVVGHPDVDYDTESGSALDYGRRLLAAGALLRHVPRLARADSAAEPLTVQDELRFVSRHHGRKWALWAAGRAARNEPRTMLTLAQAVPKALKASPITADPVPPPPTADPLDVPVTVLIPTIERYPYLRTVLDQLRHQTISASQVVVADQTPPNHRDGRILMEFDDLPLEVIELDRPGQSTARNAGLSIASGDAVLFIDDDDEIAPDLIERHLRALATDGVEVSCGIAHEPNLHVTHQPRWRQASDVFPTNNAMVRISALRRSGLFDLAFDHGVRADGDLGMRLYLAGCRLVLDPSIDVLHHRAPRGGLRLYGERRTTYTGSRSSLLERQRLAPTELYLARRYFTERQVREMLVLRQLGTLSRHGSLFQRALRAIVQLTLMPSTIRQVRAAAVAADRLGQEFPRIPVLDEAEA